MKPRYVVRKIVAFDSEGSKYYDAWYVFDREAAELHPVTYATRKLARAVAKNYNHPILMEDSNAS